MSTVAKIFVVFGLVVLAFPGDGGTILACFLVGIGLLLPRDQQPDPAAARVEALDAYVRELHRWIVEREATRAAGDAVASDAPLAEDMTWAFTATAPAPANETDRDTTPHDAEAGVEAVDEPLTHEPSPLVASEPIAVSADDVVPEVAAVAEDIDAAPDEPSVDETAAEPIPFPPPQPEVPEAAVPEAEIPEATAAFSPVVPQVAEAAQAVNPAPAARAARPTPAPQHSLFDFEQILGTNWLAKVGVAILVIGVSFFLAWQLRELGPAGKISVGAIVGFVMLGTGIWFERNERYRILARAVLAGGWALLFFVSWAAHHVTATRVVDSPAAALALMLAVAAAMVAHTLRYRSQVVTGLAFVLAFSTVAVNQADVFGLTANVVLALGFSAVIVRMRWFPLEIVGIAAAYLNHYLWLHPVVLPEQAAIDVAASAGTSIAILLLYWAIFRASFVIRRAPDEKTSVIAGLLNSGLLLAVLKGHPASDEAAFRLLLALGVVELVLSRLPVMRTRRDSFVALTTLGTMFITAAIPLRFAPASVTVAWLVNAIVLTVVGIVTRERVYRRLGTLVATATAVQLIFFPLGRIIIAGFGEGAVAAQRPIAFITLAVAAWLLVEATLLVQRWSDLYPEPIEQYLVRALGYLGVALVVPAGFLLFPQNGTAVFWAGTGLVLAFAGRRMANGDLAMHATLLAAAAVLRVLGHNLASDGAVLALGSRAVTVISVALLLYALAGTHGRGQSDGAKFGYAGGLWAGTGLLVLLAGHEVPAPQLALAWTCLAFALAAIGQRIRNGHLVAQANAMAIVATAWMFAVGFASDARLVGPFTGRLLSAVALAGLLYLLSRWNRGWEQLTHSVGRIAPRVFANLLLMTLAWHELPEPAVAVGWALLGFALLYAGRRTRLIDLVVQANAVAAAAAVRILVVNLPSNALALEQPFAVAWRIPASLAVVGLLYALGHWNRTALQDFGEARAVEQRPSLAVSQVPQWAGTALLVLLAWYQLLPAAVAIAWTLGALLLLEVGLRRGSRSLVLQASVLFVVTFGRVFVVNMNIDDFGAIGGRVFTIAPIAAAFLYAYWRSDEERERGLAPGWFAPLFAWLGLACVTALLRFQLAADAVVAGWAALTLLLVAFAALSKRRIFAHIAIAVTLLTLSRGVLHNLYERSYFPSPGAFDRWMWIGAAALLLFASLPFAFRLRSMEPQPERSWLRRSLAWLDARPEQLLFFAPLALVTVLIGVEMRSGMLTVAWGLEGVIVFVFALLVGERSFRLSGLALLLLCVGKIFVLDFWALALRDKALTGIVIGLSLIGVSILYSRKRETILKYL